MTARGATLFSSDEKIISLHPNITPLVGAIGHFKFSIESGVSTCDPLDQRIIGAISDRLLHDEVADLVDDKDRQKFLDVSLGTPDETNCASTILRFKNGNVVKDTYKFSYHAEDYAQRSLVAVEGTTELIGIH